MEKIKLYLSETRNVILAITAILGFIGTLATGVFWVDDRYAKAEQIEELDKRVTLAELRDQLRIAQEEYFFLRSQARKYPNDLDIQEQLTEAKEAVSNLKDRIREYKGL